MVVAIPTLRGALWKLVIVSKFRKSWEGWYSNDIWGSYGVDLLIHIKKGWETFPTHARYFEVGDGSWVKFWHNKWRAEQSLKETFHDIYDLVRAKNVSVDDLLAFYCSSPQCNVNFIRVAQDWELQVISDFFALLYFIRVTEGTLDKINWRTIKRFIVRSIYTF